MERAKFLESNFNAFNAGYNNGIQAKKPSSIKSLFNRSKISQESKRKAEGDSIDDRPAKQSCTNKPSVSKLNPEDILELQ